MKRAGFVAVIGAPNAGKSTLVNRLVGTKVTIVTQKVQTTRFPIRGLAIVGDTQLVLVDTPGIFEPRRRLDRAMVRAAWSGAHDADVVAHLIDVQPHVRSAEHCAQPADRRSLADDETILAGLKGSGRRAILVLNKVDLIRPHQLLPLVRELDGSGAYEDVLIISAATGAGVDELRTRLAARMPAGEWLYPSEQHSDLHARIFAAELTREKLFLRVHEELPYSCAVETTKFEEGADGSVRIEQTIFVEREGQRGILIGKGGETLKWIGKAARLELTASFARPVHLFLHVKVNARWAEQPSYYRDVGLDPGA
ncbi:MAG: GTPase Era [Caulobacteraceae bacterium]